MDKNRTLIVNGKDKGMCTNYSINRCSEPCFCFVNGVTYDGPSYFEAEFIPNEKGYGKSKIYIAADSIKIYEDRIEIVA